MAILAERPRGFFAVGIEHSKCAVNVGTLWRSASIFGASYIFTVGARFKRQPSDTRESWRHIPAFSYATLQDLVDHMPHDCMLVGIELDPTATPLAAFTHPTRAVYLLGAEDWGLSDEARERCQRLVVLPGEHSMNVSVAGSIVLYDRVANGRS